MAEKYKYTHTLTHSMTNNKESLRRQKLLLLETQECEKNGLSKSGTKEHLVKMYHQYFEGISYSTQRQDIITVLDKVYKDD